MEFPKVVRFPWIPPVRLAPRLERMNPFLLFGSSTPLRHARVPFEWHPSIESVLKVHLGFRPGRPYVHRCRESCGNKSSSLHSCSPMFEREGAYSERRKHVNNPLHTPLWTNRSRQAS